MEVLQTTESAIDEIAILGRVLNNGKGFPVAVARQILKLDFNEEDKARMHTLALGNQTGSLSAEELHELKSYANAGCLLGILHSKARQAIKKTAKK